MEMDGMRMDADGRMVLMLREGVRLKAYRDVKGIWTIGAGHCSVAGPPHVWPWTTITTAQADEIFARDLIPFEDAVNKALKRSVPQGSFNALVSLCFNIGPGGFAGSSVVKQINLGNMQEAANDFLLWDHPPQLLERRKEEREQFLRGFA